ncbi:MAG: GtrA family protein [Legionellales bacterium]|nr:GtrA family protein [Legionellales bacterium]
MKQIGLQFARYTLVGVCSTATQYAILILLVELFGIEAVIASTIGCIFGSIVSYFMNHRFTFRSAKRHREALWQFYSIVLVGTLLNAGLMYLGIKILHLQYIIAQLITTGLVFIWNFSANRAWTFRD